MWVINCIYDPFFTKITYALAVSKNRSFEALKPKTSVQNRTSGNPNPTTFLTRKCLRQVHGSRYGHIDKHSTSFFSASNQSWMFRVSKAVWSTVCWFTSSELSLQWWPYVWGGGGLVKRISGQFGRCPKQFSYKICSLFSLFYQIRGWRLFYFFGLRL